MLAWNPVRRTNSDEKKCHATRFIPACVNNARIDVFLPWWRATAPEMLNAFCALPQYQLAQNPGIFLHGALQELFRCRLTAPTGMRQSDFIYSLLRLRTLIKSRS
jgi:hypothetical protein